MSQRKCFISEPAEGAHVQAMSWPGGGHSPEPGSFFDLCFLNCPVHTHEGWSEADSAPVGLEQDLSFCTVYQLPGETFRGPHLEWQGDRCPGQSSPADGTHLRPRGRRLLTPGRNLGLRRPLPLWPLSLVRSKDHQPPFNRASLSYILGQIPFLAEFKAEQNQNLVLLGPEGAEAKHI